MLNRNQLIKWSVTIYLVALPKSVGLPILLLTFLGAVGASVASSTETNSIERFYDYNSKLVKQK
jgi:hypothetical protein